MAHSHHVCPLPSILPSSPTNNSTQEPITELPPPYDPSADAAQQALNSHVHIHYNTFNDNLNRDRGLERDHDGQVLSILNCVAFLAFCLLAWQVWVEFNTRKKDFPWDGWA
jgi:hypothetical protein